MRERAIRFGAGNGLVGILAEPTPVGPLPDRPAIIFLNSGILHRVGSCRMHVRLARALAAQGYPSLRFDFSGIGDSDTRKDSLPFEESAPLEIVEAMDRMGTMKGTSRFILYGLCSGADAALLLAPGESRVCGLGLVDPWAYPTAKTRLMYYLHRLTLGEAWMNQLHRYLPRLFGPLPATPDHGDLTPDFEIPTYVRALPPREEVAAMLRAVLTRGSHLFLAYMGGSNAYTYRRQFQDGFAELPFGSQLRLLYLADSDHIVSGLRQQARLDRETLEWITTTWPLDGRGAPPPAEPVRHLKSRATSAGAAVGG